MNISCDDGCASDTRLAELCAKYGIDCTFYWPVDWHSIAFYKGYEPLAFSAAQDIAEKFDIGSHTITHRHLTRIPPQEAEYEIEYSRYMLEDLFGVEVNTFAPPRGYTNDLLTEFTMRFYDKQRLTKEKGLVHIHPDSGVNGNIPWRKRAGQIEVTELFCHSQELDKFNLWKELEDYFESISS